MPLKETIKSLPLSPGVYHFLDEKGVVLYVGKAKNLKNRVRQYFLKELGRGPAIDQMVAMAADIKWIETESEIEAVLLEAELIKKLKPKYNIRLKDDKSFLVIKIAKAISNFQFSISNQILISNSQKNRKIDTLAQFPTVELVRFRNINMKSKDAYYFGPYPAGDMLKKSLRYLRKIFPFRDCSKTKFNTYAKKKRPCIYGDIGVCTGPCADQVDKTSYNKNIIFLKNFLRGKKAQVIKALEKEMISLSKSARFEEAALVRNQLKALEHIKDVAVGIRDDFFRSEALLFKRIECYDISNIGAEYCVGSMVVFSGGKPDKAEYRKFKVKSQKLKAESQEAESDLERLREVLERRFARQDWTMPDLLVIDGGIAHLNIAKAVLQSYNLDIPVMSISKGPERKNNDLHFGDSAIAELFKGNVPMKNIIIAARDEAHRFAISYYRTLHRKGLFE